MYDNNDAYAMFSARLILGCYENIFGEQQIKHSLKDRNQHVFLIKFFGKYALVIKTHVVYLSRCLKKVKGDTRVCVENDIKVKAFVKLHTESGVS